MEIKTPGEAEAYVQGLEAHAEARRIMQSPEYQRGDPAAHAKVRLHFLKAYGSQPVRTAVISAGSAPLGPGSRRE